MLPKLNGMFASPYTTADRGELFLARDRMGKKPLYYAESTDAFVFGSELKAVLASPTVAERISISIAARPIPDVRVRADAAESLSRACASSNPATT